MLIEFSAQAVNAASRASDGLYLSVVNYFHTNPNSAALFAAAAFISAAILFVFQHAIGAIVADYARVLYRRAKQHYFADAETDTLERRIEILTHENRELTEAIQEADVQITELSEENARLHDQLLEAAVNDTKLETLKSENAKLRERLSRADAKIRALIADLTRLTHKASSTKWTKLEDE